MIETFAIIQSKLPDNERTQVRRYLEDWADGYVYTSHHNPDHRGIWTNKWQSHRVKLITLMAVVLDDPELLADARTLLEEQVAANTEPTGEALDFKQRGALHYVVYGQQPLVQTALAARIKGEDWYHWHTSNGASLAGAAVWLKPYVSGQKTHGEFEYSHVHFDVIRAQAGLKGVAGPVRPARSG